MSALQAYLPWLPTLAGALHFVQLPSMLAARRVLAWDAEFLRLSVINRRIVQVMAGGILVCVLGLGSLMLCLHGRLLGEASGVGLCVFSSVFWTYRAAVQVFVYARIWPASSRWSQRMLSLLFVFLASAYAAAALLSGSAT